MRVKLVHSGENDSRGRRSSTNLASPYLSRDEYSELQITSLRLLKPSFAFWPVDEEKMKKLLEAKLNT